MTDYQRISTLFVGAFIGVALSILGFYVYKVSPNPPVSPQPVAEQVEKHGTFTVVSEYQGCDLVQWQYGMLSEYKYFLHCSK
jgi:hypothetical protein